MINKRLMLTLCLIYILVFAMPGQAQDVVGDLLGRINNLRASLGLAPYTINSALSAAAANHAQWMAANQQVSHVQADGSRPRDRALAAGYNSSWISENIFMGPRASPNSAWNFWVNSPIHYAGLTSPNYEHVGIATANGAGGQSFVLVFGNPNRAISPANTTGSSGGSQGVPAAPPSFVVGVDSIGNIMHEVQPGDTLGDIALIYGYTWEDVPYMLEINGLTPDDIRALEIGSVFLVPPQSGTYTPAPGLTATSAPVTPRAGNTGSDNADDAPTQSAADPATVPELEVVLSSTPATKNVQATARPRDERGLPPPAQFVAPSVTAVPAQSAAPATTATNSLLVRTLPAQSTAIAAAATSIPRGIQEPQVDSPAPRNNRPPLWLIAAIVIQVGVLSFAAIEFIRRLRA